MMKNVQGVRKFSSSCLVDQDIISAQSANCFGPHAMYNARAVVLAD